MTADTLKLLRYRYGTDVVSIEMQDRLHAASVVKDISGKEDIHLSMLGSFEEPQSAFTPGDFVALKDQTGSTWSWGRVSVVRSTLKREVGGTLTHAPYAVMVQGWYDFLTRSKIHVMSLSNRPSVGTLFNINEWYQLGTDLTKMYGQPPGLILQFMLRKLLRIKLPPSLGGGWFSDEIPVVYNRETALRYAPEFEDIEPVDFGELMPQLSLNMLSQRSSDVGALIGNMFLFENSLVELIPYMSTGGGVGVPTTNPAPPPGETPEERAAQAQQEYDTRVVNGRTALGNILGAQPVLVYRIKPFRAEPLYRAAVAKIKYRPEDAEAGYLDRELALYDETSRRALLNLRAQARADTAEKLFTEGMFRQVTFTPPSIVPLPYSYIMSFSRQRSDAERVNATSINAVPGAQPNGTTITDIDYLGLPVAIDNQIENHGLRLRMARWSMYPKDSNMSQPGVDVYYRAVAAQVMQFYEKAHLYETGSLQLHFAHTQYFVESDTRQKSTYDKAVLGLEPGRWFRTMFKGLDTVRAPQPETSTLALSEDYKTHGLPTSDTAPSDEYYGYVTAVSHSIQRLPSGAMTANTQVNFMRGHFAEMWDVVHGVNVPMNDADRPPGGGGGGGQSAGGGRACSLRPGEVAGVLNRTVCDTYALFRPQLAAFNSGEARLDWGPASVVPPIMNSPYMSYGSESARTAPALPPDQYNKITQNYITYAMRPAWLYCWFLEAISVMPTAEFQELKPFLNARDLSPSAESSQASLWALASCAYVIEAYWRSRPTYDRVRLRIRAIPRAKEGGYHKLYAAMDFYLEYPPDFAGEQAGALQVWASLFRLAEARRIPYGGRGLYLNVNPDTGVTGVTPAEAGQPSRTQCQYPPGGSSWTHYDLRGMWGINTLPSKRAFFTSWAATDWNGDGKDEIQLSNTFQPPEERTQNGGVQDTADYVWANVADPTFQYLEEYVTGTKASAAPGVSAIMRARKDAPNRLEVENRRVPVRSALRNYYGSNGLTDGGMHAVTARVPNMFQVAEMERIIGNMRPVTPVATADESNAAADLYLAKFADGSVQNAPLVVIFGGINVGGEASGVYMRRYAQPLFRGNHVVIAKNDKVAYADVLVLAMKTNPHTINKPRTLYIFSNGVVPTYTFIRATAGAIPLTFYSSIYMVDAYLGSNTTRAKDVTEQFLYDMRKRPQYYAFFYTNAFGENGMTQATRDKILGGGATPEGIAALAKISVSKGSAATDSAWHMQANEAAIAHLLLSDLTE